MILEPLYACLEKNQAEEEYRGNNCPGITKCEKLPVTQVQVAVNKNVYKISYWTFFSQEKAQLRLHQVLYPGRERVKSLNNEARINGEVTEAGAELSIIRWALD